MSHRGVAFLFHKAIPAQVLRIPIIVCNERDSMAGLIGCPEVIEARTALNAVLEGVHKDAKVGKGVQIGLAVDIELGMCANCGDVDLVHLVAVASCKDWRGGVGSWGREIGHCGVGDGGRGRFGHAIGITKFVQPDVLLKNGSGRVPMISLCGQRASYSCCHNSEHDNYGKCSTQDECDRSKAANSFAGQTWL